MKLYNSDKTEKIKDIEEKMIEMVVTHELIEQKNQTIPLLTFGNDTVKGEEAILAYLDELYGDMKKGYFCTY